MGRDNLVAVIQLVGGGNHQASLADVYPYKCSLHKDIPPQTRVCRGSLPSPARLLDLLQALSQYRALTRSGVTGHPTRAQLGGAQRATRTRAAAIFTRTLDILPLTYIIGYTYVYKPAQASSLSPFVFSPIYDECRMTTNSKNGVTRHVLPNGLVVLLKESHKAP